MQALAASPSCHPFGLVAPPICRASIPVTTAMASPPAAGPPAPFPLMQLPALALGSVLSALPERSSRHAARAACHDLRRHHDARVELLRLRMPVARDQEDGVSAPGPQWWLGRVTAGAVL